MPRSDWSAIRPGAENPAGIDVRQTPIGSVASKASVIAATAQQFSSATGEITIYRRDERDHPTPVNVDRYLVWTDLQSHQSFPELVQKASTENNDNLKRYLKDNVFLVKQFPGPDHWLGEIPSSVSVVLRSA